MSGDGQRAVRSDGAGNGDIRATNDPDGTLLFGGAGDDILRGGRYNDVLTGGSGDDKLAGGDGADQFRFFGDQNTGNDSDDIYDLDFSEGDTLVLGNYGAGTFQDDDGVNAFGGPTGSDSQAIISSWEGVVNAVNFSDNVTALQEGNNGNLILRITDSDGDIQDIVISGGWSQYLANGGTEGVPGSSI